MKIKPILIVLIILITTFSFSQNGQKNFIDQPFIEVTGIAETEIIPDEIYVKIILTENDKKRKMTIEKQEDILIKKLKSIDIDVDNCFTILDFDGYYKRKFLSDNEVVKTKSYQLIISNERELGEVYKAMDDLEVSNVGITKVSHSEIEKIKRDLKIDALKTAKNKAKDYCVALDQTLGKAIFIRENQISVNNSVSNTVTNNEGYSVYKERSKIYDLNISKINLTASIHIKFKLN
jgi:uncharacterized protein YggE